MKLIDRVHLIGSAAYGLSAQGDCNVYMVARVARDILLAEPH
jgi:hypothetical protein